MTTLRTDSPHSGITIDYANGSGFVHGGSGLLSVYSEDEKNAIKTLQNADNDTYYLFVIDNVTRLNEDGSPMKDILAGYMPIGRQHGFLFGVPAAKYVAHELGHGAFGLHHTFSSETESFSAPQYSTNNLMDYAEGATLNHKQWTWMHEKHRNVLGFLDGEEESEYVDFYFYDYFFRQIHSELSSFADGVKSTVAGWFKSQKKEEKPVIPELSDDQKAIIEILKGIHDAEMSYTIRQLGMIYDDEVDIEGHKCQIALHIQPDLEFRLAVNGPVTMTKKAFTRERHDDYTLISFKQSTDDKKIALAIQVDKDNADWLVKYLENMQDPIQKALTEIETYIGRAYHNDSGTLRTGTDEAALAQMDCSELVCRFLQLACGLEDVSSMTTADFKLLVRSKNSYVQYVTESDLVTHTDIQPGDIFLWRIEGGPGHVGVVKEYSNDVVTIIEAIGNSGSAEERTYNSGACKGCIRESRYTRTGNALIGHKGWQGYFRPIINTK